MRPSRYVIGLTGDIAAGKSTVTGYLRSRGYLVIDADIVARDVVVKGSQGLGELVKNFGCEILLEDGTLNRRGLGSLVFGDDKKLSLLNSIMHPRITGEIESRIEESDSDVVFVDGALLFETGFNKKADEMWYIRVPDDLRLKRLMDRDGFTEEEAKARINSFVKDNEYKIRESVVIDNEGDLVDLFEKVEILLQRFQ